MRSALILLAVLGQPAMAELLRLPPLPERHALSMTFEILPAEPGRKLADDLHVFEGGRLQIEEANARGASFLRATFIFPLPNGDTRERVVFFAEEGDRARMIGFHNILRRSGSPTGETIVFNPAPENPMKGRAVNVPSDTYTYLALCTTIGGAVGEKAPRSAHLWVEGGDPLAVEIVAEGREELAVLGSRVRSVRLKVKGRDAKLPEATYWVAEAPPHSFLQYRGPADFLVASGTVPTVVLRATSSSDQFDRMFDRFERGPN